MNNIFKYIGYLCLFIFSFIFFLYWTFPFSVLKDRIITAAEQQLGGQYSVKIGDLSSSLITGVALKDVKITKREQDKTENVWGAAKVKIRTSLTSILFGKTNVKFAVKNQKSEMSGSFKTAEEGFSLASSLSNFNIGDIGMFSSDDGVKLVSEIDGSLKLNINKRQMIQSSGSADFSLSNIKLKAGELKIGEGINFTVPELIFSKGSGSSLKVDLSKGAIHIIELKLADGDLKLDLSGDIFMSQVVKNYRMNLKGTFSVTPKLEQAIPLLFMVEKQRQPDGTYPITITGRIEQPSIKIGEFTLPL
ncbi:MAG: type II secretion system protein GspN [Deltaproteobacteria bacterium]|nr:type II secretion system protein GspN [Deltaproteobacteria bacterium]